MGYIYIGIGGFFGALARYSLGKVLMARTAPTLPGTFVINLTGAFLLGLLAVVFQHIPVREGMSQMVLTGFFGAYTTFSTFSFETAVMIRKGRYFDAARYVALTLVFGIILCFCAFLIAVYVVGCML